MRASLYGPWYSIVQRPHHLARLLVDAQASVDVYTLKRLRYAEPQLDFDVRVHKKSRMPGPLKRIPFLKSYISQYESRIEENICRNFCLSPAEISIYYGRPHSAVRDMKVNGNLIYDCLDDFEGFSGISDPKLLAREEALCDKADYIWVVSKHLEEKLSRYKEKVRYVPNGVSFEHFSIAADMRQPVALSNRRPCLVYVGAIYNWFDAELVGEVAEILGDWDVVLIGPTGLGEESLRHLNKPNIKLLGMKHYNELPGYLALADVAMIPFKINQLTNGTSPIKLFEYLAAGLPVVATQMPEVLPYQADGVVVCEESPVAFAHGVQALAQGVNVDKCQQIARSSSWRARFAPVLNEIGLNN